MDAYIKCECGQHIIVIDDEYWASEKIVSLSIWAPLRERPPSLWWRIKEAWRAFRLGEPYSEWVLLDERSLHNLRDALYSLDEESDGDISDD